MTLSKTIFSLVAFLTVFCCTAFAGEEIKYQLPKADQWAVKTNPGDQAELVENDGVLELKFKVKTDESFQAGHLSYQQAVIQLYLKNPIKLAENQKRVLFEAKGIHTSTKSGTVVLLMPVIQDENGEKIIYMPQQQDHLKSGTANWSGWKTHSFYSTEAGGASSGSFTTRGGDNNSWPDGKLTFLGFELAVRDGKQIEYSGIVELGGFALAGDKMPYRNPYFFADAFLKDPGDYKAAIQVLKGFQATPCKELIKTLSFDPRKPSLARQKIFLELGSDDNYWISYQITDNSGKVIANDQIRAWVEGNDQTDSSAPVDLESAPVIGYLRINPGQPSCGVYEREKEMEIIIRAFPKDQQNYQLAWRVERLAFPELITEGNEKIEFNDRKFQDIKLRISLPEDGDAFKLIVKVKNNDNPLDEQEYVFGRKSDLSLHYRNRNGKRITRDQIKESAYIRISYLPMKDGKKINFKDHQEYLDRFTKALQEISQITTNVTYMIDIREFEVLPGVFDFFLLDKVMDAAYDQNCRLTIRMSHADAGGILRWERYWPQRNHDGTINYGHKYYGSFTLTDREYVDSCLRAFKTLHDRYQDHPAFQGYQLFEIAGEWAVLDRPWEGNIVTYEKPGRKMFVQYLQKNVTDDLGKLNKRWGTSYKTWDEVKQPMPDLEAGTKPDLRMQWMDFCKFKLYLDNKYWFQTAASSIREYDKDSVVIVYSLDPGGFEESNGFSPIDYLHNGGNHILRGEGTLMAPWNKNKIGWITEPHHPHRWAAYGDKDNRGWLLDWTTYIMLAQAGGGGANMHIYYWPLQGNEDLALTAHYDREYALDRFEKWQPLLREMHGIRIKQNPPQIGVFQDIYTLFCKHRTVFQPRMDDLRRWFELLKMDSLQYEDFRQENQAEYKLLLPNILDEVMSDENISKIGNLVKNGAKAVISARTGSLCPERKDTAFPLLAELGIKAPATQFKTTDRNVQASVITDNPFFKQGQKIDFYSLADLKNDLESKDMKQRFSLWTYRWLPQTDYFGYYPNNKNVDGRVLATFPDGGTAVSLHKCGKGEVLVFWGMPDYTPEKLKGFMQQVADWAGIKNSRQGNPVPLTMEGDHENLNRHYAIMYQDEPGTYKQKLPEVPDGNFFISDLVSGQRLGIYQDKELREGIELTWVKGYSPLKILRMIPYKEMGSRWTDMYRTPETK